MPFEGFLTTAVNQNASCQHLVIPKRASYYTCDILAVTSLSLSRTPSCETLSGRVARPLVKSHEQNLTHLYNIRFEKSVAWKSLA